MPKCITSMMVPGNSRGVWKMHSVRRTRRKMQVLMLMKKRKLERTKKMS